MNTNDSVNIVVCAMDLGIKNFAVAIEKFDLETILKSKKDIGLENSVYSEGTLTYLNKLDLAPGAIGKKITDSILIAATRYLVSIIDKLKECDVILIEHQYKFRNVQNSDCIHLEHHIQGILLYLLEDTKTRVKIFAARHKTKTFDNEKMTKPQRKAWTVNEASNILLARQDYENLALFKAKKDDYADVIMMIQAYKFKLAGK